MGEVILTASEQIDGFLRVVIARWRGEYVTWILNEQTDSYNHGNYFTNLDDAIEDYIRRRKGYGVETDYWYTTVPS